MNRRIVVISTLLILLSQIYFYNNLSFSRTEEPERSKPNSMIEIPRGDLIHFQFMDDMDRVSLEKAVKSTIEYFKKIPGSRYYYFSTYKYSRLNMIKSLNLFLSIIKKNRPHKRKEEILHKFRFFSNISDYKKILFTAYYESSIKGSTIKTDKFDTPVYPKPEDLNTRKNKKGVISYYTRKEIVNGKALHGKIKPLLYVNKIDLFFMQIEGSGIIILPDNKTVNINYAGDNGHPYISIEDKLKKKNLFSQKDIRLYLKKNPKKIDSILNLNPRYIFFQKTVKGAIGDTNIKLIPGRSIAMDPSVIPRGALAIVESVRPYFNKKNKINFKKFQRFVLVHDSGSAIKGKQRVDLFWGRGKKTEKLASKFKVKGNLIFIVARKEFL